MHLKKRGKFVVKWRPSRASDCQSVYSVAVKLNSWLFPLWVSCMVDSLFIAELPSGSSLLAKYWRGGREGGRSLPLPGGGGGGGMHERLIAAYDRFFDTHLIRRTLKIIIIKIVKSYCVYGKVVPHTLARCSSDSEQLSTGCNEQPFDTNE